MDFSALLQQPGKITDHDVRNFRGEVFADGLISLAEAEAVFAINSAIAEKCDSWVVFFVEAIVDFTVNQAQPKGYVSVANGQWLIDQISSDGKVENYSEIELLVKTIEKSANSPQFLVTFALNQIANAVVEGNGQLLNNRHLTKGVLGENEVELIRRILFAYGGDNGISISRAEAEILFDLNDKTVEVQNHPSWSDLFMKAVANHLMAVSGYQSISRQEAIRREEWLADTQIDVTGALANSLRSIGSLFSREGFSSAFKTDQQIMEEAWSSRNRQTAENATSSVQIDTDEGEWLAQRIGRDGIMHQNERVLLKFIKEESPMVHPAIKQLFEKIA